ncbi:oxidoreductase [Mangrovihabitans endophyticus]|uniref:Oxidoreductase n=2 Tax=Mangrovihabitans endophyticus TaxID=1751298 RepID=A0A8J3C1X8_9ACTN|nr:oxidoreductase [Mangrovihabitans endophyticus]
MRYFVTGASGWIGSAVVPELLKAGHQVTGLARSDAAAETVAARGAQVRRGELGDLDVLRAGASASDGVIHLGFIHDFSRMAAAAETDRAAINAIGSALEGTGRPFLIASGVVGLADGRPVTERDMPDANGNPRMANAAITLSYAERGVRPVVVRFAPSVHGEGDHGFLSVLVGVARERGFSAYVGDGSNRWPAVHCLDAGRLVRLAVERAPAGTNVHAVAEEGVPTRDIAEAIGRGLGLPVKSVSAEEADEHFGWIGRFFGADVPASNAATRKLFDWHPAQPGIIDDLDAGHYFKG